MCAIAPITVFIVDKSSIIQERLRNMLVEIEGIDYVGYSQSVPHAIEAVSILHPDVVIHDVQLADGNGLDLLKAIKLTYPPPFVIILSNDAYPPYRKAYGGAGADFFLDKSTEFEQIPSVLVQLMSGSAVCRPGS